MTTTHPPAPPAAVRSDARPSTAPARRLDERRLAAIGGIGFATIVLSANVVLGGTPAFDAPASEVISYLDSHRAQSIYSTSAFAVGALFLLSFVSGFYGRLKAVGRPDDLVWARLGMFGAFWILPSFALVSLCRLVLIAGADEAIGSPELVALMWRLESAAFELNSLPMAAAVLGFGIAGGRAGLLPRWFAKWAPVAAACGVITAACAIAGLEGSPIGFGGLVPFLTWMTLLLTAGIKQLRVV